MTDIYLKVILQWPAKKVKNCMKMYMEACTCVTVEYTVQWSTTQYNQLNTSY